MRATWGWDVTDRLKDIARIVRSKNAGPTLLTLDVLFADDDGFRRGIAALTARSVARRYGRKPDDVTVIPYPPAHAIKIVMGRSHAAGGAGGSGRVRGATARSSAGSAGLSAFRRLAQGWPGVDAPLRVLSASGQLGFGIPKASFERGLARKPHVIAADMGSVDPGPAYLGSGTIAAPEALVRSDLAMVLRAARALDVPLLIGSAGTAGAGAHLTRVLEILRPIAREERLSFSLGLVRSDMSRHDVMAVFRAGRMTAIGDIALDEAIIAETGPIVGQAGMEPFRRALGMGADVILAGRACDTAPFAVIPVLLGYPPGPAIHMAKILECTSLCCEPGGRDAMLATLQGDGFVLESMHPDRAATPVSVAAHALYEQADPFTIHEPEGVVTLEDVRYEPVDARRVRVTGARWRPADRPTVKIEGARRLGSRAVMLCAAADPAFIDASAQIVADVEAVVRGIVEEQDWTLHVHRYGIDGVTDWPAPPLVPPREMFLLSKCVAPDEETARLVLAAFRQQLLHFGFPGRRATGGNIAFPLTPPELGAGDAYAFSIYHILEAESWDMLEALFPVTVEQIGVPS